MGASEAALTQKKGRKASGDDTKSAKRAKLEKKVVVTAVAEVDAIISPVKSAKKAKKEKKEKKEKKLDAIISPVKSAKKEKKEKKNMGAKTEAEEALQVQEEAIPKKEPAVEDVEPVAVDMNGAADEDEPVAEFKVHKKVAPAELEDITLNCRDCQAEFIFSVGQQEFFKSKGFGNGPTRCKECTAAKKARFGEGGGAGGGGQSWGNKDRSQSDSKCYNCGKDGHMSRECPEPKKAMACYNCGEDGHQSRNCPKQEGSRKQSNVCYAFQKGQCSRGDSCKFSHAAE